MRILLVSPTYSGIGGTAQHMRTLAGLLRGMGHDVDVISSDDTPVIPVRGLRSASFAVTAAVKAALGGRYDIINAHNVPSALAMRVSRGKRVLSLHGIFSAILESERPGLPARIARWFEMRSLGWADAVTAESRNACRFYEEASGIHVHQVPNGVDVSGFPSVDRRHEKQVISVGRLSPEKGTRNLARIAGLLPDDVHLLVLGAGPDEQMMREAAAGRPNVHCMGYVEKARAIPLIRGSDVLVQPSFFDEVSSSILEAMSCGTAVVASDLVGTAEMVRDGESGVLVDPRDPDRFAKEIVGLLDDPGRRGRLEEAAAEAAKGYGWDVIGKRYVELYESLR